MARALSVITVALLLGALPAGCDRTEVEAPQVATPLQREFSWVVEDRLAGMPRPGSTGALAADVDFLAEQQIDLLVSLTEATLPEEPLREAGIALVHLPVEDFQPPTQGQLRAFLRQASPVIDAEGRVGVHCEAGRGRTGTFLAAWLVSTGMTADEAIEEVRRLRPGSVETEAQEEAVRRLERAGRR